MLSVIQRVTAESILLFPKDFMVLTSDPVAVKSQYITTNPDAFITLSSTPSFPDDLGDVIVLNNQGKIVDGVKYSDKWHFPLISNTGGVSLERIEYEAASERGNFHSAATSVGYGTPGYKDSQKGLSEDVSVTNKSYTRYFSPDNDGTT